MSPIKKEPSPDKPDKSEPRNFWRELARGPKVSEKKEPIAEDEPEEVEPSPQEWKTKEVADILKKYDSHIKLNQDERADLAEKADPGKKITKKKHITDTLRDLRSEYKSAPDADKKRIAAESKKSLDRFLKGK